MCRSQNIWKGSFSVDLITPSCDRITKKLWSHIDKHNFLSCQESFNNVTVIKIASKTYYKIFQSEKLSLTGFETPSAPNLKCQLLFLVSKALEFIKILYSTFLIKILLMKQIFKKYMQNYDAVLTIFRARHFCHILYRFSGNVHINNYQF